MYCIEELISDLKNIVKKFNLCVSEKNDMDHSIKISVDIFYDYLELCPFSEGNEKMAKMLLSFCLILKNVILFPITLSSGHSKPRKHYMQAIINRQDKNKPNDLYYLTKISVLRVWKNFNTYCGNF